PDLLPYNFVDRDGEILFVEVGTFQKLRRKRFVFSHDTIALLRQRRCFVFVLFFGFVAAKSRRHGPLIIAMVGSRLSWSPSCILGLLIFPVLDLFVMLLHFIRRQPGYADPSPGL